MIVIVLVAAGAGYLVGNAIPRNITSVSISATTATTTVTSSISSINTTGCGGATGPYGPLVLQVLNGTTGKPIGGEAIYPYFAAPACNQPGYLTYSTMNKTFTNSTGYVTFGGGPGEYDLYVGAYMQYYVSAAPIISKTTCVTLSIPSGDTNITYSQPGRFAC
jgi:hypothetical protein